MTNWTKWMLAMKRGRAKSQAARPGHHVSRLRGLVQEMRLEVVEYEWQPDPKLPYFVDIYCRSERHNQALAIDGTWDGRQELMPKHKRALVTKFLTCARLEVPHIFIQTRQPAKMEMTLRMWVVRALTNPSWAFPGGAGAWPPSRWLDLVAAEAALWDWRGRWHPPSPAASADRDRSPGPG